MQRLVATLLLLCCAAAAAQQTTAASKEEIAYLFQRLEQSGCQFYRNGSWHSGQKAAKHLQKKYVYLLAKELVPTTAVFIERAATKSSISGKPYRVRCTNHVAVDSGAWFTQELVRWREQNF